MTEHTKATLKILVVLKLKVYTSAADVIRLNQVITKITGQPSPFIGCWDVLLMTMSSVSLPSGNQKQVTWQLALLLTHIWLCEFPKTAARYQKLVFTFCAIKRINGVSRVVCWIESAQSLTFWSDLFKPQKAVKASLSMLLHSQDEAGLTVPGI